MEIYQYKRYDKNTIISIINNRIWFSKPSAFNDPYDCLANFNYYGSIPEWNKFIKEEHSDLRIQKAMLDLYNNDPDDFEIRFNNGHKDSISNHLRVACFSRNYSNVLLWSHYAEFHKGICIGYEVTKENGLYYLEVDDPEYFVSSYNKLPNMPIIPVDYKDEMSFEYNPLKQTPEDLLLHVFSKGNVWKYEKELRSIIKDTFKTNVKLGDTTLSSVYLGSKMDSYDIYSIKIIITMLNEKRSKKIKLYQMKLCSNCIKLRPEKIVI
jgi:hypothetical protein